jgi:hypothetical protein
MSGKQAIQVALRVRPKIQLETDTFDATKGKEVCCHDIACHASRFVVTLTGLSRRIPG